MRVLSSTDRNELVINDAVSGGSLTVYYRMPTSRERAGFQAKSIVRTGKKVRMNVFEARSEYGLRILTGIGEGDFGAPGDGADSIVPISSDPKSRHYREDWKALIEEHAADVVQTLAYVVFEGVRVEEQDMEFGEEDAGDAGASPLEEAGASGSGEQKEGPSEDPLG